MPAYDGEEPEKTDGQHNYTFAGWTPALETVKGEATYTATYSYDVTLSVYLSEGVCATICTDTQENGSFGEEHYFQAGSTMTVPGGTWIRVTGSLLDDENYELPENPVAVGDALYGNGYVFQALDDTVITVLSDELAFEPIEG